MAVLSSGCMGMISGSTVANVVTTGTMTIPMMKKIGYTPEEAGAVETVASSGGQVTPPIMGTVAFLIADFIGVQYWDVKVVYDSGAEDYWMGLDLYRVYALTIRPGGASSIEMIQ